MLDTIREGARQISEYILLTSIVVVGGIFAIKQWRESPYLPLAGAFLGPVGGMFGSSLGGEPGAIMGTVLGCFVGPGAAVMFTDRDTIQRLVNHALDRIAPERNEPKDEEPPQ